MRASIALRSEATELIRLRAFAEAFARDCGFADDQRARLLVILEELFTNVVAHGYGAASVAVALGWRRGWLTIDFVDDGPPLIRSPMPGPIWMLRQNNARSVGLVSPLYAPWSTEGVTGGKATVTTCDWFGALRAPRKR
jgi:anti-sigma regulatory factor (Ser/Thr protein kinase)